MSVVSNNDDDEKDEETTNPYLALRAAKIARNQARLRELGLMAKNTESTTAAGRRHSTTTAAATKERRNGTFAANRSEPPEVASRSTKRRRRGEADRTPSPLSSDENTVALRRSARLVVRQSASSETREDANATTTTTTGSHTTLTTTPPQQHSKKRHRIPVVSDWINQNHTPMAMSGVFAPIDNAAVVSQSRKNSHTASTKSDDATTTMIGIVGRRNDVPKSDSARAIHLDVNLLMGHFLGKVLDRTGKAAVMERSAQVAAVTDLGRHIPDRVSFNKYSGVQEWADGDGSRGGNVVYLWINFGAPNADVVNEFLNEGRRVTWFGGSRMQIRSPIIQKLIRVGSTTRTRTRTRTTPTPTASDDATDAAGGVVAAGDGGGGGGSDSSSGDNGGGGGRVILWGRNYLRERKAFSPYMCFGRLSLVAYDPKSHPLSFVWQLDDYEYLIHEQPDENAKENFKDMMNAYRGVS